MMRTVHWYCRSVERSSKEKICLKIPTKQNQNSLHTENSFPRDLRRAKNPLFSGWLCARGGGDEQRGDRVGCVQRGAPLQRACAPQAGDNLDQETPGVSRQYTVPNFLYASLMKGRCLAFRLHSQWIVTNLFIYWLPHCTVTAIKGKLGEKFTFELTPYIPIYKPLHFLQLCLISFLWFKRICLCRRSCLVLLSWEHTFIPLLRNPNEISEQSESLCSPMILWYKP